MIKKTIFLILTILVILFCLSAAWEFLKILKNFSISSKIELLFIIGFVAYLIVHLVFYKPVFIHVMSHELTHMLWAAIFGGKTKKLEVSDRGGKVLINKSNFLISLAPYFFPLYTLVFVLIYLIADKKFLPVIAFFIGASLASHVALTLYSLKTSQSDFYEDSNIVFSLAFVFLMNIILVAAIFSMLSDEVRFLPFIKQPFLGSFEVFMKMLHKTNEILK